MKVALIQATNPYDVRWNPPLGFAYLAAYAKRHLPDVEFVALHDAKEIQVVKPDVLGVSALSQDAGEIMPLVDAADRAGARVVLGGHHVSNATYWDDHWRDFRIFPGEGEYSFTTYLADLCGVELGPPPKTLDDLPMPDHSFGLLPGQKPYLLTSRGCPYGCTFCVSSKTVRMHSAQRVAREVYDIQKKFPGIKRLGIWDDLFTMDRHRLVLIAHFLKDTGLKFSTSMRASHIDPVICRVLKSMNLRRVGIGAESGSDNILPKLKGARAYVAQNQYALNVLKEMGMQGGAGFIVGHWDETEADLIQTYEFILKNYRAGKLMQHEINILTPMPGTEVWRHAEQAGYIGTDFRWSRLRYLAMNSNNIGGRDRWMQLRRDNDSLYLNEENVPQETLYEIINHYEDKISRCSVKQVVKTLRKKAASILKGEGHGQKPERFNIPKEHELDLVQTEGSR